jgi:hypothetical protein
MKVWTALAGKQEKLSEVALSLDSFGGKVGKAVKINPELRQVSEKAVRCKDNIRQLHWY